MRIDYSNYRELRRLAYPPIEEQLDMIYHDVDGWRALIQSIKQRYPEPERKK